MQNEPENDAQGSSSDDGQMWLLMVTSPGKNGGHAQLRLRSTAATREEFMEQLREAGFCLYGLLVSAFRDEDLADELIAAANQT